MLPAPNQSVLAKAFRLRVLEAAAAIGTLAERLAAQPTGIAAQGGRTAESGRLNSAKLIRVHASATRNTVLSLTRPPNKLRLTSSHSLPIQPFWEDLGERSPPKLLTFLVPGEGFEPPANGLQNRCSTPELTRQIN